MKILLAYFEAKDGTPFALLQVNGAWQILGREHKKCRELKEIAQAWTYCCKREDVEELSTWV